MIAITTKTLELVIKQITTQKRQVKKKKDKNMRTNCYIRDYVRVTSDYTDIQTSKKTQKRDFIIKQKKYKQKIVQGQNKVYNIEK